MNTPETLLHLAPALAPVLAGADHVDVKHIEGDVGLRPFVAGMLSYNPAWMRALYAVRWLLVRLLGMKQRGVPDFGRMAPADVSMTPGDDALFFRIALAEEERLWVAGITERHLSAHLGVVVEPLPRGRRFHVVTVVHYRHWTGPLYFNLIRPFHHLVVRRMMQAGLRAAPVAAA